MNRNCIWNKFSKTDYDTAATVVYDLLPTQPRTPRISGLKSQVNNFGLKMMMKSGLLKIILKFHEPL